MTALARQHALEVAGELRLSSDDISRAYEIVESALGADWLDEQERRSERYRAPISDAHTLFRVLATPTHEAHAENCELAIYLQTFANDPAMNRILQDLRTDKYSAVFMELAFAYRWRTAGALVTLRPLTSRGEADFEAVIGRIAYVVEASIFPNEIFKLRRFRLPQIIGDVVGKLIDSSVVKVKVSINEYPSGNVEAEIHKAIAESCRHYEACTSSPRMIQDQYTFGIIQVDEIVGVPDYNPFIEAAEEQSWDICLRHTKHRLRVGAPIYDAEKQAVEEVSRIFVGFPKDDVDIYELIYKKLKREASQLSGFTGPRVVLLDTTALGDVFGYNEQTLRAQLSRVMCSIPELACVWLSMRKFLALNRHRYYSLFVPNPDSNYQIPHKFLTEYGMREWQWDYLRNEPLPKPR